MSDTGQEKRFAYRIMCAECDHGNMEQFLNLPKDHGVYFQNVDQPLMNANDHDSGKHILQFGRCTSPKNPENWGDTLMSSIPGLKWVDEQINKVQNALGCDGCKCKPMVLNSWKDGDEANRLDGAPAITNESKAYCLYGGIITIKEMEESTDSGEEASGESQEPQEKHPLDTLPEAMKNKIAQKNEKVLAEYNAAIEAIDAAMSDPLSASGVEESLAMIPENVLALMSDTEQWYKDNPLEFIETHRVSEEMIEQNYMHNRTQVMALSCLNDGGYIADGSQLYNFNVANSTADQIGASCVASYNLMRALAEGEGPLWFPDIIRDTEYIQTCPGYMDGGPMAASMFNVGQVMENRGFATEYSIGSMMQETYSTMEVGEAGVLGTVVDGIPQFYTFQVDQQGALNCLEKPELKMDTWTNISNEKSMFIKVTEKK